MLDIKQAPRIITPTFAENWLVVCRGERFRSSALSADLNATFATSSSSFFRTISSRRTQIYLPPSAHGRVNICKREKENARLSLSLRRYYCERNDKTPCRQTVAIRLDVCQAEGTIEIDFARGPREKVTRVFKGGDFRAHEIQSLRSSEGSHSRRIGGGKGGRRRSGPPRRREIDEQILKA